MWGLLRITVVSVTMDRQGGGTADCCKELIPGVIAAVVWGKQWKGLDVKCHSDNQAVVAVTQTRSSRDPSIMHLIRCLSFIEAQFEFYLSAEYISGRWNDLADDLSRNPLSSFLQKATRVSLKPTTIPQSLRDHLLVEKPDWLSQSWTYLFNNTLREVYQVLHLRHIAVV